MLEGNKRLKIRDVQEVTIGCNAVQKKVRWKVEINRAFNNCCFCLF